MNAIILFAKKYIQKIVDKISGKPIDIVGGILYTFMLVMIIRTLYTTINLINHPEIINPLPPLAHAFLIGLPIITFTITLTGNYLKKPSRRLQQFVFAVIATCVFAAQYAIELANTTILNLIFSIENIDVIPYKWIEGNIKMVTFFIPVILVLPVCLMVLRLVFDEQNRRDLIEYEVDLLLPTAFKMDNTTVDIEICEDIETGEKCIVPEKKTFEHIWVQGGSGSGKSATSLKPIINQLYRKKGYLIENEKKLAIEALREGIAVLKYPVSNEWFNSNFTMNYIKPAKGKEKEFKAKFKKYIIGTRDTGEIIFKNLGITVIAPDGGLPLDTVKMGERNGIETHKIDPKMEEILKGNIAQYNPLKGGRPDKTGDIISSILVSMEQSDGGESKSYFVNASMRAIRNVVIALKVMYPRMYNFEPTLADVLDVLNNFNSIEPIIEEMKKDSELVKRWGSVIDYFETSFYSPEVDSQNRIIHGSTRGSQRKKTEEAISGVINQLDNLLGREEIRYILCDRENSLDLKQVLENGECIAIATRQNELGPKLGRAFALFFILNLQNEVLSRYSEEENPEIPYYIIIDEFPMYVNEESELFFTFSRKYRCSVTIAIQNMGQLKQVSDEFGETIFANTDTKILLPKTNVEDRKYWSTYFGTKDKFEMQTGVTTTSMMSDNPNYSEMRRGTVQSRQKVTEQDINDLNFKEGFYCYTNSKGRQKIGKGITEFVLDTETRINHTQYDFEAFNPPEIEVEETHKTNQDTKQEDLTEIKEEDAVTSMPNSNIEISEENIAQNETQEIESQDNDSKTYQQIEAPSDNKEQNQKDVSLLIEKNNQDTSNINLDEIEIDGIELDEVDLDEIELDEVELDEIGLEDTESLNEANEIKSIKKSKEIQEKPHQYRNDTNLFKLINRKETNEIMETEEYIIEGNIEN